MTNFSLKIHAFSRLDARLLVVYLSLYLNSFLERCG